MAGRQCVPCRHEPRRNRCLVHIRANMFDIVLLQFKVGLSRETNPDLRETPRFTGTENVRAGSICRQNQFHC